MKRISDKNLAILKTIGKILLVFLVIFLFVTKLFKYVAPFVIALAITSIIENPVRFLQKRFKLSRGIAVALVMMVFTVSVGALISFVFYRLMMEVWNLARDNPGLQNFFVYVKELIEDSNELYNKLPADVVASIEENINSILNNLKDVIFNAINWLMKTLINIVKFLPQGMLYVIITLVSTFFMSKDRAAISNFVFGQMSPNWRVKIRSVKNDLFDALIGFIKAQALLISVTFIWVLIWYYIIGVDYVFLLALLTAIFDILPIFGPGGVIIPTAIVYGVMGDTSMAFWLVLLYISVIALRQFLEPRVLGGGIGLHPLITLIVMYVGFRVFGVFGLILGPVFAIIIKSLQKAGVLPKFKESQQV